jgi:8-oxo-dGTP diphosphatase
VTWSARRRADGPRAPAGGDDAVASRAGSVRRVVNDGGALNLDEDLHLVVAGLLRRRGRGLLLHRAPTRRWYPDCWDLPGGHVEDGETPDVALRRELHEELGVTALVTGAAFAQVRGTDFRMDVWIISHWDGEPANLDLGEHDALAWLNHDEMAALRLADSRLPVLFEAALR